MSNGMRTGNKSSGKTPIAELEFLGVSLREINRIEEEMGTLWIEDLPHGEKLEKAIRAVSQIGEKLTARIVDGVERIRSRSKGENDEQ